MSPEYNNSRAFLNPVSHGIMTTGGAAENRISGSPNLEVSEA